MMNVEDQSDGEKLVLAIQNNTQWIGQTTRELRDEVGNAATQIELLANTIENASSRNSTDLASLVKAINSYSASSDKLAKKMVALTWVLALAAVASALASCLTLLKH